MSDIVERLRNPDALRGDIDGRAEMLDTIPTEALMREAADEIERLLAFAESFGRCSCEPGSCDTKTDFQCRAREALDGISNEQLRK